MSEDADDPVRRVLKRLVEHSNAPYSVDDIFREFRTKSRRHKHKLLKLLETISKAESDADVHLKKAAKDIETKDPIVCLFDFLDNYSDSKMLKTGRKKDISHSTPLNKIFSENVTPSNVSEIKDRVLQAVTSGGGSVALTRSNLSASLGNIMEPTSSLFNDDTKDIRSDNGDNNWDYISKDLSLHYSMQQNNLIAIPIESQENIVMYDLLYALTGMRGSFIVPLDASVEKSARGGSLIFKVSEQVHQSISDIAKEILPLASHYSCIQMFVQRVMSNNCSQVLQALGEALGNLMGDYFLLLSQLESEMDRGNLTMHKMLFYLRPTLNTMEVLAGVVAEIVKNEYFGGRALTLLCDKINALTGDEDSQKFLIKLTQLAAVPYMKILQSWVQKGVISDPQHEFLVEDNELIRREELPEHYSSDYWERRYTVRTDRIPCFLTKHSDVILRTGKYLNVIRQCGKDIKSPPDVVLEFSPLNQHYVMEIENAYKFASKNLLDVLLNDNDLMGHLISVKRYSLLHQGDFMTQFMDACEEELLKNVDEVQPMKLENLLGLTLRLSSAKMDPYKDDVHCTLLPYDLVTQMSKIMSANEEEYWQQHDRIELTGLECFAFRYEVQWPISLVLNHISISKYQMLFRQLFYCKHVERQLCKIWKENAVAKKFSPLAAEQYRAAFTLRQRMMNAIQNLEYYMMIEVIEPNWHEFLQKISKVENVDEVLTLHQDFLDSCLKDCMLSDTTTLSRSIFKLCKVALEFCEFIQKSQRSSLDAELKSMVRDGNEDDENSDSEVSEATQMQSETSLTPNDMFSERVKLLDLEFTGVLLGLLKQISDIAADFHQKPSDRIFNLVHRINFNSFYNQQMDLLCAKDAMAK